jgi:putative hydrolase of the HAD superfamily
MKDKKNITTIFTDIGGVLLTNGWDRGSRNAACEKFKLDSGETQERHHLTFDTYEVGKLTLDEYLERVVFYKKRTFTPQDFKRFMYSQSKPYPHMIELLKKIRAKYRIRIAVVNNEGRELNEYRIKKFGLAEFVDFFISSSYVHFRKPDADIFRLALDVANTSPKNIVYLEDRPMFVQVANGLGIKGIVHTDYENTVLQLAKFGLSV